MAASTVGAAGRVIGNNSSLSSPGIRTKDRKRSSRNGTGIAVVCCHSSLSPPAVSDPYKTLRIRPGASESEVKKTFRRLALQYHPDVCRGSGEPPVPFHEINQAYDMVMNDLRGESQLLEMRGCSVDGDEDDEGMNNPGWEPWEEWMGWDGAGIRDYSSHINPYI
ncbi:hypothetical protein MLD38_008019 [Melastoma candidum]|uniref:Uncharacterized protein n=1 Tax=Melastoma candidum TaxID=119954 RepID=A0ACB9RSX6_9MYRT|nr:hypothetical protein MLD38_008019 [Melastoma candidum]